MRALVLLSLAVLVLLPVSCAPTREAPSGSGGGGYSAPSGPCSNCSGTGLCEDCGGDAGYSIGDGLDHDCSTCGGTGKCRICGGSGQAR